MICVTFYTSMRTWKTEFKIDHMSSISIVHKEHQHSYTVLWAQQDEVWQELELESACKLYASLLFCLNWRFFLEFSI